MEQAIDIKAIRSELGLTQTALAEVLGVDQGTVSNWERAAHVPRGPARKLLERLRSEAPDAPAPKAERAA